MNKGVIPLKMAIKTTITILFAWMFDSLDLMLLIIMLSSIADKTQLNFDMYTFGSLVVGVALLTSGLGGIFFGYLADRIGRKKTLSISILIYSLPTLLVAFINSWQELLILRLISGFGVGGAWAAGITLIAETIHPNDRGKAIGIVQCGFPLGFMLAVMISRFIAYSPNAAVMFPYWRNAFVAAAIPAIILSLYVALKIPESKIWLFKINNRRKYRLADLFLNPTFRKRFIVALIIDTTAMFSYWLFWSWLPTYLEKTYFVGSLSITSNFMWLLSTQIGALIGYITYGCMQDKMGRRPTWSIFTACEGILMFISVLMISMFISNTNVSYTAFVVVGFFLGYFTGYWSAFGTILSELFPTDIRSSATGFAFNIGRSINFVSPIIVGFLAKSFGFFYALSLGAIASIVMSVTIWILPETKGKDISE